MLSRGISKFCAFHIFCMQCSHQSTWEQFWERIHFVLAPFRFASMGYCSDFFILADSRILPQSENK